MRYFIIIPCVCIVVCFCNYDGESPDRDKERRMVLEKLTKNRTVLEDGYHLVSRQMITDVLRFTTYRSVSVIFYLISRDVTEARFTFQSEELQLNKIGSCDKEHVIIKLKRSSFPAVNAAKYDFPKDFISPEWREKTHTIEIYSDGGIIHYSIKNPKPGNWYAIIYIQWEDPRLDSVQQDGLVADCNTFVYTDLQVKRRKDIHIISCDSGLNVAYADIPADYKCMIPDTTELVSLTITITDSSASSDNIFVRLQSQALGTEEDYILTCTFDPKVTTKQTIKFSPNPNTWHYIQLDQIVNASRYADCESYAGITDLEDGTKLTAQDLMRDVEGRFFTVEWGMPNTDIQDSTSLIKLTSEEIKAVRFEVNPFVDIGGNLAIDASLIMGLKYYMGYKREKKDGALLAFSEGDQFYMVVICMNIGYYSIPLRTGHCKYNDKVKPAIFMLNSTDSDSIYNRTVIPYPESGTWYLTLRLFCDNVVCPCRTSDNGTKYYVDLNGQDKTIEDSNAIREGANFCNTSVLISISSSSCINGKCENHGSCLLNTMGGIALSYCHCSAGYGGWDCSDDSRMDSIEEMLLSLILLTSSNLLFSFSMYIAIIRLYYTEAIMYSFTLVSSTFYHACDAPAQISYCITKGSLLQFGDFYCGIMCFWVTILATCIMADRLKSALQLVGAIVIAFLTTWNMHSLVSFTVPMLVGVALIFVTWFLDYRKARSFKYPRSYYTIHLPIGLVLVSIGLICYAFLQTEENYRYVHSFWHGIIATSVIFLLPDVKRQRKRNAFLPNTCIMACPKIFKRS